LTLEVIWAMGMQFMLMDNIIMLKIEICGGQWVGTLRVSLECRRHYLPELIK
jgi:hypothetical protein